MLAIKMLQRRSSEAKQQRMNTCNRQRTLLTVVGLFKQPCIVPFYLTMVILVTACLIRRSQVAGHVSNQEINFRIIKKFLLISFVM